jgi:transcriptional regulator with XRE-family HTH domain
MLSVMNVKVSLPSRIRRWRVAAGLTMAELGSKCVSDERPNGVSSAAVSQWEDEDDDKGTTPTSENLEKIAKACGLSMAEFWGDPPALPASHKRARAS